MTITDAKAYHGLIAGVTPSGTNVANNVLVGEALATTTFASTTDIVYTFKVTSTADTDVATLTLSSGAVAQTTGTPTITDGDGNDFEGVALPTLVSLYGLMIKHTVSDAGSAITIGGTALFRATLCDGGTVGDVFLYSGYNATLGTVSVTFTDTGDAVEFVVIGRTS